MVTYLRTFSYTQRFEAIFSAIDIQPIFAVVAKKTSLGRSVELCSDDLFFNGPYY